MLRAAVVGTGSLAYATHLPNLQKSKNFELVATCRRNPELAEKAMNDFGAQRFHTDWHEVTEADDIDMIVLATHTNLRGEIICEALKKGKPVYTEKPLSNSRREMMEILRASRETGLPVCVGHNRRSGPAIIEFKRLIDIARLKGADRPAIVDRNTGKREQLDEEGQTQLMLRVNDDIRTWKLWIFEDEEGIILAEMVHFIDLALWLIPSVPVQVYACGSPRGNFTEIIRFRDGSIATLQHSMVGNFDYPKELFECSLRNVTIAMDHHMEVRQRGLENEPFRTCFPLAAGMELAESEGINAFYEVSEKLQEMRRSGKELPTMFASPNKGHAEQLERFGQHIQGKGENPCPVESAIVVTNVALKLFESAKLGIPVKVGPEDYDIIQAEREAH
jgi:predicted dehydrogenase